ncbi:FHA domain-containing protein [Paraliomyxa miuraensis]|uniref:FHA domain-containing protein n=1 Tax=Paraliomyxa miuraensis TaxID=376150 RepID=UPI00225A8D5F|nr:FHA domain-containing protein [Paraliomyxa miuraensis]MCX4247991.1 FHA domain-containing protein [Paraliomyxa miuraensis]
MSLRLIIEDDEGSTTVVPLASDAITIGRQQGNTIQLTEKNVSRRHARLFPESDGWVIEDLGSYNGIKVNNDRIEGRTKLREGDVVEIGDYHLAITEDVDKSPLNFRTGGAANDGATMEPMLVSSSADLPRLSPEEIAALQSGQQPITPPQRMGGMGVVDSGPIPAGHYHPGYAEPEGNKKTGLYVFLAIVVLGVVALAVFWVITQKGDDTGGVAAGDKKGQSGEPAKAVTPPPDPTADGGGTPAADDGGSPTAAEGGTPVPADDGAADAGDDVAVVDDGEPVEDDGAADDGSVEVIDDSAGEDPRPKQPRPKQPKPKQPKQPSEPKPTVDAAAALQEARDKQFTDPSAAYRLAKQSYGAKPSSDALWVMGPAACRLKDKSKAQWVLKRLKGADKTKLQDICAQKGLEI